MRAWAVVVVLLAASAAGAGPLKAPFMDYLPGSAEAVLGAAAERGRSFWFEWRFGADKFAWALWKHPELRRRVGAPLDEAGLKCILWTRVAELVGETHGLLERRYGYWGKPTPSWIRGAPERARKKADEACDDKSDGEGGTREENLGRRYLREWKRLHDEDAARRATAAEDAAALQVLTRLAEEAAALAPAVRGGLAPAGGGVPLVNPCLLDPKLCKEGGPDGT